MRKTNYNSLTKTEAVTKNNVAQLPTDAKVNNYKLLRFSRWLVSIFIFAFSFSANAQFSVTSTSGSGSTTPLTHTSLKSAFDSVNNGYYRGVVSISVTGNSTESAQCVLNSSGTGSASYTSLSVKPASGVTATIDGSISTSIIKLDGADNVTIDGSNTVNGTSRDLTIRNNFQSTPAKTGGNTSLRDATSGVIWIASLTSNGATGNTIKNCIVRGSTRRTTFSAIWSSNSSTASATLTNPFPGTPAAALNNVIDNNAVGFCQHGIRNNAAASTENWTVTNNTIDSTFTNGIFISNAFNTSISGNTINSVTTISDTTSGTVHGIQTAGLFSNSVVSFNKIVKVRQNTTNNYTAAYSARGMTLVSGSSNGNNIAANNQVCDVSSVGIGTTNLITHGIIVSFPASSTANSTTNPIWRIYNNSVNLTTASTSPNNASSAFSVSLSTASNAGSIDVRNNIFANNISTAGGNINHYSYFNFTAATFGNAFWGLDNNAYYTSNANLGSNNPTLIVDLAALRTATSREANGVFVQPTFTSATDLHLSAVSGNALINNGGAPLTQVTTDIDGNARSRVFPDIGADEIIYQPKVGGGTPSSACAGGSFKLFGADLSNPTAATLAGVAATSVSNGTNSDTVVAVVAGGYTTPVTGVVSVTTSLGSSTSTATVTRNAPGSITSQSLSSGSVGDQIRFVGTNLAGITTATINGTAATIVSSLASELIITVGVGSTTGDLIVTDGCGNAINRGTFIVNAQTACTTPSDQASSFNGTFTTSALNGTFSAAASNPSGYLVVVSTSALSSGPVDGVNYTNGTSLGGGTVRQSSSSLQLALTGLTGNTAYRVTIYSYNGGGCTSGPRYNTTSPLTYDFTTCSNIPNTVVATPNSTGGINNVVFTWAIPTEGGANARTYSLEVYNDLGYTSPVSGSPFTGINALTYTVSNLNFATTYYYRIRTNNGCFSNYATGTVLTSCGASSVLPYSQNFNSFTPQDLPGAGSTIGCWIQENVNADAAVWKIGAVQGSGATIKSSPYCLRYDAANTYAGTGTVSNAANDIAYSPGFILTAGTQYTLSFWQSNFTNGENLALKVYNNAPVSTNFNSTIWSGTGLRNLSPIYVAATFTPTSNGTYYFGFHITSTANGGNPSAISQFVDNFKLEVTPPAPSAPSGLSFTSLTSSSFTVNWADNSNNEDFFDIYISEDGVTYTLNQSVESNVTSANISNQNSSTLVYVRVVARNSGGSSSPLDGSVTTLSCNGIYTTNTFIGNLFAGTTINWNLNGNWSLGRPPLSCDDVVINLTNLQPSSTTINYLYLNANATMHNLTISGSNNPVAAGGSAGQRQALFIFTNGYKMDITGDLTISNDSTGGEANINNNVLLTSGKGNGPFATGPITVLGTTTIGNTGNRIASLGGGSTSGPGSITLKGDVILGPQAYLNYGNLISYYFEKGGNQTLTMTSTQDDGSATYGLGDFYIGNTTPTNLTIAGSGTSAAASVVGNLTIGANSSLTIPNGQRLNRSQSGGGTIIMGANSTMSLGGTTGGSTGSNFPDSFSLYNFNPSSTVVYNGTTSQSISASPVYSNLTVNNASGVTVNGNTTVNGTLTLTSGIVSTGSNKLTMGTSGTISGAGTSKHINGTLEKSLNSGATSASFEIGDGTNYTPVSASLSGVTTAGTISAKTTTGMPSSLGFSSSGISPTSYLNRTYNIATSGLGNNATITPTFNYVNSDLVSSLSNSAFVVSDSLYGGGWSVRSTTNSTATSSTSSSNNANNASEYIYLIGEVDPAPAPDVTSFTPTSACIGSIYVITGSNFYAINSVKVNNTSVSYVVNSPTQITITLPVGVTTGVISVSNATGTSSTSDSLSVNAQPQTTVSSSSQTICSGETISTIVLGNSGNIPGATYSWTRTGGNSAISGATSGTTDVSGVLNSTSTIPETVTYSVVASANGCTGTSASATITVKASPGVASVSPSTSTICQTSILQLDGSYTAATGTSTRTTGTISTNIPDGSIAGVLSDLTVNNIPAGAVVTRIDVGFSINHTFNSDLAINISAPNGKTLNLAAGVGNEGVNFVNTIVSSTGVDVFPTTTTNNITGTFAPDAVGGVGPVSRLSNASSFSELYSIPNGTWRFGVRDYGTPDAGTITNWNLTIYYTLPVTFSWSPTNGLFTNAGATTPYSGGGQQTVYVKNTPGNYSYTANISSNGCTSSSTAATVDIEAVPVATRTNASQTICSGDAISSIVLASTNDPSAALDWTRDNDVDVTGIASSGTGTISGTLNNITAAPQTTTFTITPLGSGSLACPGNSLTATVTVNPIPLASVSPSSQTICNGSAISPLLFLTTNGVAGTTFAWTRNNTSAATGIAASGTAFVSGTLTNTGGNTTVTFDVTAVGPSPSFCAGAPATATVTVNNSPSVFNVTGSGHYCSPAQSGRNVGLSGSQLGVNYQLYKDAVIFGSPVAGTGNALDFGVQTVGTYTVVAVNGCNVNMSGNAVLTSTSSVAADIVISTATTNVCSGSIVAFSANVTNGGTSPTIQWMKNGQPISGQNTTTYSASPGSLITGDVITCSLTSSNTCASTTTANSNQIVLNVLPSPAITPILNATANVTNHTFCTLGTGTYFVCRTNGGTWSSSNTGVATVSAPTVISGSSGTTVTSVANGQTILSYTLAPAANGCSSTSSIVINVANEPAPAPITGNATVCVGVPTSYSTTLVPGATWSTGGRSTITSGGVLTASSAGTSTVNYTTAANSFGCKGTSTLNVTFIAAPPTPTMGFVTSGYRNPFAGAPSGQMCANRTFGLNGFPSGGTWGASGVVSIVPSGLIGVATTGPSAGPGSISYTVTSGGCPATRTINFTTSTVCGARGNINNTPLTTSNNFSMFPNPANNLVKINIERLVGEGQIVVTSLIGKQVITQPLSMGTNNLDISSLSKGMYMVSIITSNGKTTQKLVKE